MNNGRCLERIKLAEYTDTYCQLPAGHEGAHTQLTPEDIAFIRALIEALPRVVDE